MKRPSLVDVVPIQNCLAGLFQAGGFGRICGGRNRQYLDLNPWYVCLIRYADAVEACSAYSHLSDRLACLPIQPLGGWCGGCLAILHHVKGVFARRQNPKRGSNGDLALGADGRDHLEVTSHGRTAHRDREGRLSSHWT